MTSVLADAAGVRRGAQGRNRTADILSDHDAPRLTEHDPASARLGALRIPALPGYRGLRKAQRRDVNRGRPRLVYCGKPQASNACVIVGQVGHPANGTMLVVAPKQAHDP